MTAVYNTETINLLNCTKSYLLIRANIWANSRYVSGLVNTNGKLLLKLFLVNWVLPVPL